MSHKALGRPAGQEAWGEDVHEQLRGLCPTPAVASQPCPLCLQALSGRDSHQPRRHRHPPHAMPGSAPAQAAPHQAAKAGEPCMTAGQGTLPATAGHPGGSQSTWWWDVGLQCVRKHATQGRVYSKSGPACGTHAPSTHRRPLNRRTPGNSCPPHYPRPWTHTPLCHTNLWATMARGWAEDALAHWEVLTGTMMSSLA